MKSDLDDIAYIINGQAKTKGWNTTADYCIERLIDEMIEFVEAKTPKQQGKEGIDMLYFILQAILDTKPKDMTIMQLFDSVYESNWIHKKKTIDENGNPVRR